MNNKNFQDRLAGLMSLRKITGQAIADKVKSIYGEDVKISQRIVSRYKTGQAIADDEMQEMILRAISEISNIPSDAHVFPIKGLRNVLKYVEEHPEVTIYDPDEYSQIETINDICDIYVQIPVIFQEYLLENFDAISLITHKEFDALQDFAKLNEKSKKAVLNMLSEKRMLVEEMLEDTDRVHEMAMYMKMIGICKTLNVDAVQIKHGNEYIEKNFRAEELRRKLAMVTNGAIIDILSDNMIDLLTMDATDWYMLMQIKAHGLGDIGEEENKYTEKLGIREAGLYTMLRKMTEGSEKIGE